MPTHLLQKMQDYKLTTFCAPPTMYRFMLQEDVASYDLSSIQNFSTAGEPLNPEVYNRWQELTGKEIREGFGQTEVLFCWQTSRGSHPSPARPASRLRCMILYCSTMTVRLPRTASRALW